MDGQKNRTTLFIHFANPSFWFYKERLKPKEKTNVKLLAQRQLL